jgi:hypothetical protein
MTHYKISKEELETFAKKVYEEACYGYLDLKDSVCEGMLRDFLDGRKMLPLLDTNIMAGPPPMPINGPVGAFSGTEGTFTASYPPYSGGTVTITGGDESGSPDGGWEITTDSINDIPVPMSAATGLDEDESIRGIRIRATSHHHLQLVDDHVDGVRPETNFQGNESERF